MMGPMANGPARLPRPRARRRRRSRPPKRDRRIGRQAQPVPPCRRRRRMLRGRMPEAIHPATRRQAAGEGSTAQQAPHRQSARPSGEGAPRRSSSGTTCREHCQRSARSAALRFHPHPGQPSGHIRAVRRYACSNAAVRSTATRRAGASRINREIGSRGPPPINPGSCRRTRSRQTPQIRQAPIATRNGRSPFRPSMRG